MKQKFCFLFFIVCFQLLAQDHPTCDGSRYRLDVFEDVTCTKALKFGEGVTISGNFQELYLDVYEPAGDNAAVRPAIILAFGGSFIGGVREDMEWLCQAYARKGFVAVTIDYRLYDGPLFPLPSAEDMEDVVMKSVSDMKAAIRYLREDAATANLYRIDPNYIFLGGISAGSITAAHTAIIDSTDTFSPDLWATIEANGGVEGNSSTNFEYSSEVQGLVNFSGGINDASWIDANDPPFISVHDEFDGTVPYGEGFASIFNFDIIYMEGSLIMAEVANDIGVENELHTIEESMGHVTYFASEASQKDYISRTAEFLHVLLCGELSGISNTDILPSLAVYPNPTDGMLFLEQEEFSFLNVSIYNVLGQRKGIWEGVNQVDLSELENGVYLLEISNEELRGSVIKRIVIE